MDRYDLIIEDIRNTLHEQLEYIRAFDQKFGVLFGMLGVVLSLLFSFSEVQGGFFYWVSISFLGIGLILNIIGFFPRKHTVGLNIKTLVDELRESEKAEIQREIMAAYRDAFKKNEGIARIKKAILQWVLLCSATGFLCLVSSVIN